MTDRSAYPTRKLRLGDEPPDELADAGAAVRFEMVWQLDFEEMLAALSGAGADFSDPGARGGGVRPPARDG